MPTSVTLRQSVVLIAALGLPAVAMLTGQDLPNQAQTTSGRQPLVEELGNQSQLPADELAAVRGLRVLDPLNDSAHLSLPEVRQALRHLGATYQRLERWRGNPVRYHFQCEIRVPGKDSHQRFEASASTDLEAVQAVLRDAQRWHSAFIDPESMGSDPSSSDLAWGRAVSTQIRVDFEQITHPHRSASLGIVITMDGPVDAMRTVCCRSHGGSCRLIRALD